LSALEEGDICSARTCLAACQEAVDRSDSGHNQAASPLKKTSERRTSTLQLKTSVPSKVPPQPSRSKGHGIRNGLSRRPDG